MKVNEIFTSIQGEGKYIGMLSNFVRLSGCNLRCSWCDTKYAYEEGTEMTVEEVISKLDSQINFVTITGGEPLLQQNQVEELVEKIKGNKRVLVETNGTIEPNFILKRSVDVWSVSPKLSNSGVRSELKFPVKCASYWKFVITKEKDLDEMKEFIDYHGIVREVFVQPSSMWLSGELVEWILARKLNNVRCVPQLHKYIWGLQRCK